MQGVGRVVGYLQYTAAICLLMFVCTCPMVHDGGLVAITMRYWCPYFGLWGNFVTFEDGNYLQAVVYLIQE